MLHLKLNDSNPIHHMTSQGHAMITGPFQEQADLILVVVSRRDGETDNEYRWGRNSSDNISTITAPATSSNPDYFIQCTMKKSHPYPVVNKVSTEEVSNVIVATSSATLNSLLTSSSPKVDFSKSCIETVTDSQKLVTFGTKSTSITPVESKTNR